VWKVVGQSARFESKQPPEVVVHRIEKDEDIDSKADVIQRQVPHLLADVLRRRSALHDGIEADAEGRVHAALEVHGEE